MSKLVVDSKEGKSMTQNDMKTLESIETEVIVAAQESKLGNLDVALNMIDEAFRHYTDRFENNDTTQEVDIDDYSLKAVVDENSHNSLESVCKIDLLFIPSLSL